MQAKNSEIRCTRKEIVDKGILKHVGMVAEKSCNLSE